MTTHQPNPLDAQIQLLTDAGWTFPAPAPDVQMPPWPNADLRALADPTGTLRLLCCRMPDGQLTATFYAPDPVTGSHQDPAWRVHADVLPAAVFASAARAATSDPDATDAPGGLEQVAHALSAASWPLTSERYLFGELLERHWMSPTARRTVTWYRHGAAHGLHRGGWRILRSGPTSPPVRLTASRHTPAAVITTLALAD
jgi:hypothetical protein